ncbi:hypothetical protein PHYSODRAFT_361357 [Phytophthora sojae]|uniref:Uncharacterized protein n=1 Tax=Phytophthora sojae (strain P6497) TaxID=1094619 RepID=G4ZS23_PHYSP|nr:hypothetical protein PHYSODRAFT_361357 [Phytophthora sojae]EGZ14202.1 hypothetical protein PHYSODRAFT_361357 [Phytophthora sojae]|eukprot:XP_009531631.1 hypothetical protein PHYSODRAFT_361357 [Phytophthora sojae]
MTNASSRQKANNGKNSAKNAPAAAAAAPANAQVKPVSAKATAAATQAPKAAVTVAAAPTREVASAGKKPNANKNDNGAKNATPFALTDITASSVQRARQIRKTDFERFQKFHNFFVANDEAAARAINAKANAKREQVDQWVRGAVNPKALTCIQEIQETQHQEGRGGAQDQGAAGEGCSPGEDGRSGEECFAREERCSSEERRTSEECVPREERVACQECVSRGRPDTRHYRTEPIGCDREQRYTHCRRAHRSRWQLPRPCHVEMGVLGCDLQNELPSTSYVLVLPLSA